MIFGKNVSILQTLDKPNTYVIGTTFPKSSQWHNNEVNLILTVKQQIEKNFPSGKNLLINTTWFGPQFDNGEYEKINLYKGQINRLFLLAAVDAIMILPQQIDNIIKNIGAKEVYKLGNFDSIFSFNFISTVIPEYFISPSNEQLMLTDPKWLYINYNRKPRTHRVELVDKLIKNNLQNDGIITLGKNRDCYNNSTVDNLFFSLNEAANDGNWNMDVAEFGIPHDIHTLGDINLWQNHFLNIVSETEFNPWDNMFVTEKTWKPILGLRPFVINGQTKIYSWLRANGFKTFTHYFPEINLETESELEVHNNIIAAIKYLKSLSPGVLISLYNKMLPDLKYNQQRFYEFAKEQKYKIENLFND